MTDSATREPADGRAASGLTSPRRRGPGWVPPLLAVGVVMLLAGLWEGLVYLGLAAACGNASLHAGPRTLMVLGFLGTLIALERAVALGSAWAYLARRRRRPAGWARGRRRAERRRAGARRLRRSRARR